VAQNPFALVDRLADRPAVNFRCLSGVMFMNSIKGVRAVVTGGSSGLGYGIVEALVANDAQVAVVARDAQRLAEVARRLSVTVVAQDATDRGRAASLLAEVHPSVLVLNAGATPRMLPIHEQTWEAFSETWNNDVKAGFHWIQEALRLPLPRGSRVLITSSGAAINGSPLSGGYAGAKRMLWLMADYANGVAKELDLGIQFQTLVPRQIIGGTGVGDVAADAYSRRRKITLQAFLTGFGKPMTPRDFGDHVVTILTDSRYETGTAFGLKGDTGIVELDG
jgi:NAD(P)-dependent dehydrogenase (short-subunit alcohol dehydrogenase family)